MWKRLRTGLALVTLLGLLLTAGFAQADLKATAVVYAWDIAALRYQNSNVVINFDGTYVPFWHELNFDTDPWTDACGPGTSTQWAGNMYYGLYHVDNAPAGAPGFQETRNWELINCDRNGDGRFSNADLSVQPPQYRVTPAYALCQTTPGTACRLISQDSVVACTSGNCAFEIVTTFFINLDLDCNGTIDTPLPPAGLCFYAEARTPPPPGGGPFWSGPLQARISTVGGEKTVNFSPQPTAVELRSFAATAEAAHVLVTWETASEVDNVGFNLYHREQGTESLVLLNERLIPAQFPGQGTGGSYAFLDTAVVDGRTYAYYLEDVDLSGPRTLHGAVVATAPYAAFFEWVTK